MYNLINRNISTLDKDAKITSKRRFLAFVFISKEKKRLVDFKAEFYYFSITCLGPSNSLLRAHRQAVSECRTENVRPWVMAYGLTTHTNKVLSIADSYLKCDMTLGFDFALD